MEQTARRKEPLEGFEIADNFTERLLKSQIIYVFCKVFMSDFQQTCHTRLQVWFFFFFLRFVVTFWRLYHCTSLKGFLLAWFFIPTKDFYILFMLPVSFLFFCNINILYNLFRDMNKIKCNWVHLIYSSRFGSCCTGGSLLRRSSWMKLVSEDNSLFFVITVSSLFVLRHVRFALSKTASILTGPNSSPQHCRL